MTAARKPAWEARLDASEKRMIALHEAFEKRMLEMHQTAMKTHLERMASIDRRMDGTMKLLQQGARILVQIEQAQKSLVESFQAFPGNGKDRKQC